MLGAVASRAYAQCPDGTPAPCRAAVRLPAPAPARGPTPPADLSTALIVPLSPVGADTALRRLAATFTAVVAENMTVGDVRARVADNLAPLLVEQRPPAAAKLNAGAMVDGTLIKIGSNVRVNVRLVEARTGRAITQFTVEGSPDSLLALADRASAVLLSTWWREQPGPYLRHGVVTSSLPALRHYINAMVSWRRGLPPWRLLLDSAVHYDPNFLAAWTWLSLPEYNPAFRMMTFLPRMEGVIPRISSDSARRAARAATQRQAPTDRMEMLTLASVSYEAQILSAGAVELPSPRNPDPHSLAQSERAIEALYVQALNAQLSVLAGFPDTAAIGTTRRALAADTSFAPTRTLLIEELTDIGDTAGVRQLLRHPTTADSADLAAVMALSARHGGFGGGGAGVDSTLASAMTLLMLGTPWHRFRSLVASSPGLKKAIESATPGTPGASEMFEFTWLTPAYLAMGMYNRARAAAFSVPSPITGARPTVALTEMNWRGALVPPDPQFYRFVVDSAGFDSVLAARRAVAQRFSQMQGSAAMMPGVMDMMTSMMAGRLERIAWITGVLAVQRGDQTAARRALAVLDSLAATDTLNVLPLALGLRAEMMLKANDGRGADSLLVQAIETSVTRAPVRYRWLLAEHYAEGKSWKPALAIARSITVPSRLHGPENAVYFAPALKLEATILDTLGRRTEAIAKYREFTDLRADADSVFEAEVAAVHLRAATLLAESGDPAGAWWNVHRAQRRDGSPSRELMDRLSTAGPEPRREIEPRGLNPSPTPFTGAGGTVYLGGVDWPKCPEPVLADSLLANADVIVEGVIDSTAHVVPSSVRVSKRSYPELNQAAQVSFAKCVWISPKDPQLPAGAQVRKRYVFTTRP